MSEKNLYQRINAVMLEVKSVTKNLTINITDTRSYKGVSHDDVTSLLHDPITNAGIVIQTSVIDSRMDVSEKEREYQGKKTISKEYMASVTVELTAINMDKPEERLSLKIPAVAFDSGDKAFGKAISMATKYGLLKLFMLESLDREEEISQEKKTILEPKSNKSSTKKDGAVIGDYIAKVGKFKGQMLSDINPKELSEYCSYMKTQNPNMDGQLKEFIDRSREFITGVRK